MEHDTAVLAPAPRSRTALKSIGIVATGLVAGAIGIATMQGSHGAAAATAATAATAAIQDGPDRFGGRPVQGTISALSSSSITVAGTTASITSVTVVIKDGVTSSVSALATGDPVLLLATTEGSTTVAARVLAGSAASGGPGDAPDGGFGAPPGRQPAPSGAVT
jgi:hypothetical protein